MTQASHGVLITDGNERAALAVTRSLGRRGIPVYVGSDTSTSLAGRSRYCSGTFRYPSPWQEPVAYADCVVEHSRRFGVRMLLPMTDLAVELIAPHAAALKGEISIPIPSLARYHQLSNKYELTNWARANGVPVPETVFVPDGDIGKVLGQIKQWPVIVKPGSSLIDRNGSLARSTVHVAHDADELTLLYQDRWYLRHPSLIQQRIIGDGQGVFGLFSDGKPLALFAHRRIREKPPSGGVSVLRESIPLAYPITDYALKIAESANWHGVAMVEFKVDRESGVPYLMEVNGRFWGSLQLAVDAGLDFPFLTYQLATGRPIDAMATGYRTGVRSRWFLGDLDQLILRLRKSDEQLSLPPESPGKGKALRDFLNFTDERTYAEVFRLSDRGPGWYELGSYLASMVEAVVGRIRERVPDLGDLAGHSRWALLRATGLNEKWLRTRLPQPVRSILVLCKGNICRSPFAGVLLRQRALALGLEVEVVSAGIEAQAGQQANPVAKRVAQQQGVSLFEHRTVPLSRDLVSQSDLILVMEAGQARIMRERYPDAARKTFLLGQFDSGGRYEIKDPYGESADVFARCYEQISQAGERLLFLLSQSRRRQT
jgi:predicted ATP-grasp superfamily ATP-dependent carboligase/protein-tyrosine-phosphatase